MTVDAPHPWTFHTVQMSDLDGPEDPLDASENLNADGTPPEEPAPTSSSESTDASSAAGRTVDTMIGAALRAARATSSVVTGGERIANAMISSPIGRVAAGAARRVTEPLAQEGADAREQLVDDLPEAAKSVSSRLMPAVVDTIDPDVLLEAVDIEHLMERIDVNGVVERIDVNALMERVDIEALLARIDPDELMSRVDVNALLDRIDLNALMARVDVDALVQRTEIGGIIARSTTGLAGDALDAVRRQGVTLDNIGARIFDRMFRRKRRPGPPGPPLLVGPSLVGSPLGASTLGASTLGELGSATP